MTLASFMTTKSALFTDSFGYSLGLGLGLGMGMGISLGQRAGFVVSSDAGQQGSSCQAMPASRVRRAKQCRPAGFVVSSDAGQQGSSCQAMAASRVRRVKQWRPAGDLKPRARDLLGE